jgi:hypothetical protein
MTPTDTREDDPLERLLDFQSALVVAADRLEEGGHDLAASALRMLTGSPGGQLAADEATHVFSVFVSFAGNTEARHCFATAAALRFAERIRPMMLETWMGRNDSLMLYYEIHGPNCAENDRLGATSLDALRNLKHTVAHRDAEIAMLREELDMLRDAAVALAAGV